MNKNYVTGLAIVLLLFLTASSVYAAAETSDRGQSRPMMVRWKATDGCGSDDLKIELLKVGAEAAPIRLGIAPIGRGTAGQVREGSLTVQNVTVPAGTYRVKVSNRLCADTSDGTIEIVAQQAVNKTLSIDVPDGGQSWQIGTIQPIKWHYTPACGNVFKVELIHSRPVSSSANAPIILADRLQINPPPGESERRRIDAAWDWAILAEGRGVGGPRPVEAGSDYRIRVTSTSEPQCNDMSAADFTLTGTGGAAAGSPGIMTILSPNSGDRFDGSLRGLSR